MRKEKTTRQPAPKRIDDKGRRQAVPQTAQQTIPFQEMLKDDVCRLNNGVYTKTVTFEDINYQLIQTEGQSAVFGEWSSFLNYFDSALPFQLSFINHRSTPESKYTVNIPPRHDEFDSIRAEYMEVLRSQIAKGNNDIVRSKPIIFGIPADNVEAARPRPERIKADVIGGFR